MSARLIVDVDDEFTHDHSVCKGNDSRVTFESTVHDESGYQTFMDSAHIVDRVQTNSLFRSIAISLWIVAIGFKLGPLIDTNSMVGSSAVSAGRTYEETGLSFLAHFTAVASISTINSGKASRDTPSSVLAG